MDEKTYQTLEFHKVLDRLAGYCAFAPSAQKARALRPVTDVIEARRRQAETHEAMLMSRLHSDITIGGARDIREPVEMASRGAALAPSDLLDVRSTLVAARNLVRTFERLANEYPNLSAITARIDYPGGLIDAITRAISDRGEILDSASEKLSGIRRDLRIVHDRLLAKLNRMVSDPSTSTYLQEPIVTQRDGRYVIPLRSEFKGRIQSIVHDQSSSGATLFVEPLAVVEMNNQYRELQLAERDEERRILAELSRQVGEFSYSLDETLAIIAELDLALARGKYADDLHGAEPELLPIRERTSVQVDDRRHPGTVIRLFGACHPLLDQETVVPIDVELDRQTYALVITGPNTGGKTVTLKTVGLLALMAQAGLHIPAHSGSQISIFDQIFADIGDEQSIEQSLSTFSGHITNIIHILKHADNRSLVILDELGAGTDPQEGAALARALLSHLLERGITTLVTTHHPELKAFAHATPGVVNASVEFNLETLRPTYHLTIGLPGRSNALAIAQRLGLPDAIIAGARAELDPADLRAEDLLDEIYRQRDISRQARTATEQARQEAEDLRTELAERLDEIEDERREILEGARAKAASQIDELQDEIRQMRRELARARQPLDVVEKVEKRTEKVAEQVKKPVVRERPAEDLPLQRPVRLGDRVRLRKLNTKGIVTSLGEDEAEVQVGNLRVRASLADVEPVRESEPAPQAEPRAEARGEPAEEPAPSTRLPDTMGESPGMELDLRGQRADEAVIALERYLDSAYLAGLPFVRIIHGKGTGRLRQVVRDALNGHPHIKSYEAGGDQEGGEGVTVAKLRH